MFGRHSKPNCSKNVDDKFRPPPSSHYLQHNEFERLPDNFFVRNCKNPMKYFKERQFTRFDQWTNNQEYFFHQHSSNLSSFHSFDRYSKSNYSNNSSRDKIRHPPHLKGRAIGLFYAQQNKKKFEKFEEKKIFPRFELTDKQYRIVADSLLNSFDHVVVVHKNNHSSSRAIRKKENSLLNSNELIQSQWQTLTATSVYQKRLEERQKLPSWSQRDVICETILKNKIVLVCGETGSGKTTQIPQYVLESAIERGEGSGCSIVISQPRRISATSMAARVSEELLGDDKDVNAGVNIFSNSVGYHIRLDNSFPVREEASIVYCTSGVILQMIANNPLLEGISHIVLDEIHERSIDTDLLMAVIKDILNRRSDLKCILMSATVNANEFSQYFDNCPILHIDGRMFPVDKIYLEDFLQQDTSFVLSPEMLPSTPRSGIAKIKEEQNEIRHWLNEFLPTHSSYLRNILLTLGEQNDPPHELICHIVHYILRTTQTGAILVFVPGIQQIKKLMALLKLTTASTACEFYPLHSFLNMNQQKRVFRQMPNGIRKIVIATNIAETSITIPDVQFVVDTGRIKVNDYELLGSTMALQSRLESRANAMQRLGRAGRVSAGKYYAVYTRHLEKKMEDYLAPEMTRIRLEELILKIKMLKFANCKDFLKQCMSPPGEELVDHSVDFLVRLGALKVKLNENEILTPFGRHLGDLPVHPQCAKLMIFASLFSCIEPILNLVACFCLRSPIIEPPFELNNAIAAKDFMEKKQFLSMDYPSDHIAIINAVKLYEECDSNSSKRIFCQIHSLDENIIQKIIELRKKLCSILFERHYLQSHDPKSFHSNQNSDQMPLIQAILFAGLYPNVIHLIPKRNGTCRLVNDVGAVPVSSSNFSVNNRFKSQEEKWMVYFTKIRHNDFKDAFLSETSIVGCLPLILFSNKVMPDQQQQDGMIVDDRFQISCSQKSRSVLVELNSRLNDFLENYSMHPSPIDWTTNWNKVPTVLSATTQLLLDS